MLFHILSQNLSASQRASVSSLQHTTHTDSWFSRTAFRREGTLCPAATLLNLFPVGERSRVFDESSAGAADPYRNQPFSEHT